MPLPSTPSAISAKMSRGLGNAVRPRLMIETSTTAASETRSPLYASGSTSVVPNFTTLKLTPQMIAIRTSVASVTQTPGRVDVAWPGVTVSPAVELIIKSRGVLRALSMLKHARVFRALRRRGEPVPGRKAQHPRCLRRAAGRIAAGDSSARAPGPSFEGNGLGRGTAHGDVSLAQSDRQRVVEQLGRSERGCAAAGC